MRNDSQGHHKVNRLLNDSRPALVLRIHFSVGDFPSTLIRLLIMASQLDYILSEAEQLWSRSKLPIAPSVPLILTVLLLGLFLYPSKGPTLSAFPLINPKSSLDVLGVAAKRDYAINGGQIIEAGFKQVGRLISSFLTRLNTDNSNQFGKTKSFRVFSDAGEMIILPSRMAYDIRNDERLSFAHFISKVPHSIMQSNDLLPPFH